MSDLKFDSLPRTVVEPIFKVTANNFVLPDLRDDRQVGKDPFVCCSCSCESVEAGIDVLATFRRRWQGQEFG